MTWQLGLCEREINQVIKGEAIAVQQQREEARNAYLKKVYCRNKKILFSILFYQIKLG